jgi:predicted nucleic acid-binding protein
VRFSLDTNILVYAIVETPDVKHRTALSLVRRARAHDCVITLQALGELFRALTGKFHRSPTEAAETVHEWRSGFPVVAANENCLIEAMDAVTGHHLSFWDAMMWATAKHAGCSLLLSEDGDDGRMLGGVTLVNPFASPRSPLLAQAGLGDKPEQRGRRR